MIPNKHSIFSAENDIVIEITSLELTFIIQYYVLYNPLVQPVAQPGHGLASASRRPEERQ